MAASEGSDAPASRNPNTIQYVEPAQVSVQPDFDTAGVALEVVDSAGHGFGTVLDQTVAVDVAIRVISSVARLRGYGDPS
jgi:hypothetical protein